MSLGIQTCPMAAPVTEYDSDSEIGEGEPPVCPTSPVFSDANTVLYAGTTDDETAKG